eukprot:gene12765-16015_t
MRLSAHAHAHARSHHNHHASNRRELGLRCRPTIRASVAHGGRSGLFGISKLHGPEGFSDLALGVASECDSLQLAAARWSSSARVSFLLRLMEVEALASDALRVARYCSEYHADPQWSGAATTARLAVQQRMDTLFCCQVTSHLVAEIEQWLKDASHLAADEGGGGGTGSYPCSHSGSNTDSVAGSETGSQTVIDTACGAAAGSMEGTKDWLQAVQRITLNFDRFRQSHSSLEHPNTSIGHVAEGQAADRNVAERYVAEGLTVDRNVAEGHVAEGHVSDRGIAEASARANELRNTNELLEECSAAFGMLATDSMYCPALEVHAEQESLLQPWVQTPPGQGPPQPLDSKGTAAETVGQGPPQPLDSVGAAAETVGQDPPSSIRLYQGKELPLSVLRDVTDMAKEEPCTPPRVLRLSRDSIARLLQDHPNEGVRWQVYHSGLMRQQATLLQALNELVLLRHRLATLLGASSYSDLLMGGRGAGGCTSIVRTPSAAKTMLKELARGLSPYAESDVRDLATLGRKPSIRGSVGEIQHEALEDPQSCGPSSSRRQQRPKPPQISGWSVDFLVREAVRQGQKDAHGGGRPGASGGTWRDYHDYFTLGSILEGVDRLLRRSFGLSLRRDPCQPEGSLSDTHLGGRVRRMQVIDEDSGQLLGNLILHLHAGANDYPFTTLLRYRPMKTSGSDDSERLGYEDGLPGMVSSAEKSGSRAYTQQALDRGAARSEEGASGPSWRPGSDDGGEMGGSDSIFLSTWAPDNMAWLVESDLQERIQGPFFLRSFLHELGHALHYICSASGPGGKDSPAPPGRRGPGGKDSPAPPAPPGPRGPGGKDSPAPQNSSNSNASALPSVPYHLMGAAAYAPMDLKEIPSHVFEHFCKDPRMLHVISQHRRLGVPLPQADCVRLTRYLHTTLNFTSLDIQDLVLGALADQNMHGSAADGEKRVTAANAWLDMGGMKYVYVFAKLIAAAAWKLHLEDDPFDPEAGRKLRYLLLHAGGREDPKEAVQKLLGRESLIEAHGGWIPDLGADVFQEIDLLG